MLRSQGFGAEFLNHQRRDMCDLLQRLGPPGVGQGYLEEQAEDNKELRQNKLVEIKVEKVQQMHVEMRLYRCDPVFDALACVVTS